MEGELLSSETQEILRMIHEVTSITQHISENDENPDKLILNIDKYLEQVNQLVLKCDDIDDESFSDDIEDYLEEVKEEYQ